MKLGAFELTLDSSPWLDVASKAGIWAKLSALHVDVAFPDWLSDAALDELYFDFKSLLHLSLISPFYFCTHSSYSGLSTDSWWDTYEDALFWAQKSRFAGLAKGAAPISRTPSGWLPHDPQVR